MVSPRVLVIEDHIVPEILDGLGIRAQTRIYQAAECGEFFRPERALLVLTLQRRRPRRGSNAVLPIRPTVASYDGNGIAELSRNVTHRFGKTRVFQAGIGVHFVPFVHYGCLLREEVRVLDLRAIDNGGVRFVIRLRIHLQEQRQ